jgi:hypothetical protein
MRGKNFKRADNNDNSVKIKSLIFFAGLFIFSSLVLVFVSEDTFSKKVYSITGLSIQNNYAGENAKISKQEENFAFIKTVIEITNAEHLSSEKKIISNIYDKLKEIDNLTYLIPEGEFVRAYFEFNLTRGNFIDIYALNEKPATIEIYEKDSDNKIGEMENILTGKYYIPIFPSYSHDVFDLKSVKEDIVYDYIHDGQPGPNVLSGVSDNPEPIDHGNIITFYGTGTSSNGYTYQLVICGTIGFANSGTCDAGQTICTSSTGIANGVQASCTHDTTGESATISWYANTENSNGDESSYSGNPLTYFVIDLNSCNYFNRLWSGIWC